MPRKYHITDVFTETPFGGNQLAVLPDAAGLNDDDMLAIAREFNFSETTFVFPPDDEKNTRKIRIFTPGGELPFAGHPTVGTAFVLAECGEIDLSGNETRIVLEEKVGPVAVLIRSKAGRPVFVQLTAAKPPMRENEKYDRAQVAAILSLDPDDVISNDELTIEAVSVGVPFLFVPLRDLDAIARARVKVDLWEKTLKNSSAPEIFVFVEEEESARRDGARSGDGVIRARMFAPTLGIIEDPATGGAAAALAGYLSWRATTKDGTLKWTVNQGVEMGRPSRLDVEADVVAGEVHAIRVGGASVLVSSGILHVR